MTGSVGEARERLCAGLSGFGNEAVSIAVWVRMERRVVITRTRTMMGRGEID